MQVSPLQRKQALSKKEKALRFRLISEMGCCICRDTPEIHHCKGHEFGSGMGLKSDHRMTIGLCVNHHRGAEGFHHLGKRAWEKHYGTQKYWLTVTNERLKSIEAMACV